MEWRASKVVLQRSPVEKSVRSCIQNAAVSPYLFLSGRRSWVCISVLGPFQLLESSKQSACETVEQICQELVLVLICRRGDDTW